jgi:hypothetical protein
VLEQSLVAGNGQFDGFDLFFPRTALQHLGDRAEALAGFNRAARWFRDHPNLRPEYFTELASSRAEAELVSAFSAGELPDDVFDRPR